MKEETLRLSRNGGAFLLPSGGRLGRGLLFEPPQRAVQRRIFQPVIAGGLGPVYTGAFGPAPADGCAPLIVLRGLASQPGGIFQSLAHIGPAVPAKVAALVQHGRRHLIPQTVGILSQLRFASGRKLTDIRFVFLKNKSVLARRRRFFGR